MRTLKTSLHDTGGRLAVGGDKLTADDRCADGFCGVDNFLDTRYTKGNVHGGDTGEVERLERHLRSRLADGLGTDSTDSGTYVIH